MPDKWAQYAQQPATTDKWSQYADAGGGQGSTPNYGPDVTVANPTTAQNFQTAFDQLTTPPKFDIQHPIRSGAEHFGAGVFGLMTPIFHPEQTLAAAGALLHPPINSKFGEPEMNTIRPMVRAFKQDPIGQTIQAAPGIAASFAGPGAEDAVADIGAATERGGLNLGNDVLGARGPKPFKYGANPARGAYEEGVLPAIGKHSAAMKLEQRLPQAGQRVSDAVMQGGNIPLSNLASSIESPVNEASGIVEGPGGGNRSVEPIEALRSSMERRAPGASAPIYGPRAGTPFTANEAASEMAKVPRFLLPAPMEETPLHTAGAAEGRLSQPIILNQPGRPMTPALPAPRNISAEIPLAEHPGIDPRLTPMAFPAERMPGENISGFGTDTGQSGNLGRNFRELGTTTGTVPARLTREAYLSGSEHPELSGRIPESQGILRRFEPGPQGEAPGMGPGQHIGQIPGERGGPGQVQGVLRRPMSFPASEEPSGLTDLRHQHASAPDVWRTIQNLDKNTRFNPDPEVEGVNELRRDIRGGLRGNLEEATPGLKPISRRYGDLKSAQESLDRTMHQRSNMSDILKVPMFPLQSTIGRGMYEGGQAISAAAPLARIAAQSAPMASLMHVLREKKGGKQ